MALVLFSKDSLLTFCHSNLTSFCSLRLTEDEIPEEIEEDETGSEYDGEDDDDDEDDEDDDDDDDSRDDNKTSMDQLQEGSEIAAAMDGEQGHGNQGDNQGEGMAEYDAASMTAVTSAAPMLGLPMVTAEALKTDCDCTHCNQARIEQVLAMVSRIVTFLGYWPLMLKNHRWEPLWFRRKVTVWYDCGKSTM